jgi:hypothetical protein
MRSFSIRARVLAAVSAAAAAAISTGLTIVAAAAKDDSSLEAVVIEVAKVVGRATRPFQNW